MKLCGIHDTPDKRIQKYAIRFLKRFCKDPVNWD